MKYISIKRKEQQCLVTMSKTMGYEMTTITVCMGSSCFSRGNSINAEIITKFIASHNCEASVALKGCLCEGNCNKGPVIKINDKLFFSVSPEGVEDLLYHEIEAAK